MTFLSTYSEYAYMCQRFIHVINEKTSGLVKFIHRACEEQWKDSQERNAKKFVQLSMKLINVHKAIKL